MILPDFNLLVHASRSDTSDHAFCRAWLDGVVNGDARYGVAPQVISSVIRIVTHPKVFAVPSNLEEVLRFCDILLTQSHCAVIQLGERHGEIITRLCMNADARNTFDLACSPFFGNHFDRCHW